MRYERPMGTRVAGAVICACLLVTGAAAAQPVPVGGTMTPKEQAKEWFARGLERYERGAYEDAIAAYERAFASYPLAVMTFNIALCYQQLGRPVEAAAAMEKVLAAPGKLRPERIEQAKAVLAAQRRLVAELAVSCNVEGASLQLDGRQVGTSPLAEPIRVAEGTVVLQATKEGYRPGYVSLLAPGGQQVPVVIELEEASKRLGQLEVEAKLPGADIYVDGQLVARTPLRSTIPVTPGAHEIVMKRNGYQTVRETIGVAEGATGFVTLRAREDPAAAGTGGELVLTLVQDDASVLVDGQRREVASGVPLRLPAGSHVVTGVRSGYDPLNLNLDVPAGGRAVAIIDLIPTPETRAALIGDAERDVALGWGLTISGTVLAGAGVGTLVWGRARRADGAQKEQDIEAGVSPYEPCANHDQSALGDETIRCGEARLDAGKRQDLGLGFMIGGGIGIAAGVGALATGIVYLATADDPDRFRLKLDDDLFALEVAPAAWGGAGESVLGVRGQF